MTRVYDEIVDFIAGGSTPEQVVVWMPSKDARDRVVELINAERIGTLSPADRDELSHYLELEHIMRLAKAKARLGHPDE